MDKQLLHNQTEYREWAWGVYQKTLTDPFYGTSYHVADAVGLKPITECWDSILNDNGEYVDVDEEGNVIPEDTAETVALQDWAQEMSFPAIAFYWFQKDDFRGCPDEICVCEFVSLNEFKNET